MTPAPGSAPAAPSREPVRAGTRLLALLGDPVAHSLSPVFQNAGLCAAGLDAVYLALRCAPPDLAGLIGGIARAGGAGNITLPHKEAAAIAVDEPTAAVRATGACNTFWFEDGRIHGDNTDVAGFREAVIELAGGAAGATVLLLGAGGAARAAVRALLEDGVEHVWLLNRTRDRAERLARDLDGGGGRVHVLDRPPAGRDFDLVVNATSLGLRAGDPQPLDFATIRAGAALDLVCHPPGTAWVDRARALGIPAADGTAMLLHQGVAAWRRWWRVEPPIEVMRTALTAAGAAPT